MNDKIIFCSSIESDLSYFLFIYFDAHVQLVITGNVTDERGELLLGANVVIAGGTNLGAATDLGGNYKILIPSPAAETKIEATYTGFKKQKKTATNKLCNSSSTSTLAFTS